MIVNAPKKFHFTPSTHWKGGWWSIDLIELVWILWRKEKSLVPHRNKAQFEPIA
jgi:hypothetical protein